VVSPYALILHLCRGVVSFGNDALLLADNEIINLINTHNYETIIYTIDGCLCRLLV
jgi:hypothetical protein